MMGWTGVFQRQVHPLTGACRIPSVAHRGRPLRACQMLSHPSSRPAPHRSRFRPSVRVAPTMPSADFCPAVRTSSPVLSRCRFRNHDTGQISRGKTRILPRIDAGFTKCTLVGVATNAVDGGLGGHVPAGPECITPHIRFLFIVPRFRLGLPTHPASRRRTCPLANLRLYIHLVSGLSPDWIRAMHGTHVSVHRAAEGRSGATDCWARSLSVSAECRQPLI